jgi:hypothetical protein
MQLPAVNNLVTLQTVTVIFTVTIKRNKILIIIFIYSLTFYLERNNVNTL